MPFLLKDLGGAQAGVPLSAGSRFFAHAPAPADAEIVRRHKRAGLMILGRTNTPEFGLNASTEPVLFGPTRNPYDRARSAGGSSGGSAAAVAARMVPLAHASDGGGSIRIPASCCGLFGLKTTRNRNTFAPYAGEGMAGFSVEHVVTRSVRDSAAALDATAGPAPGDPYYAPPPARPFLDEVGTPPGRLRIALATTTFNGTAVHPDCVAAAEQAARLCADLGHAVEEATPRTTPRPWTLTSTGSSRSGPPPTSPCAPGRSARSSMPPDSSGSPGRRSSWAGGSPRRTTS